MAEMYGADTDEFLAQLNGKSPMVGNAANNNMSKVNLLGNQTITRTEEDF